MLPPSPTKPALSIREAIALKRAEAKKASSTKSGFSDELGPESLPFKVIEEEPDPLGRLPLRETIERARSSGNLNIASRELQCIPSALYEIHLGITPEPLKLVTESPLPSPDPTGRKRAGDGGVSWYDAQDLVVLHASNNEIVELQPELSMFGSLKNLDFHNNKISALPPTIADLMALVVLDLSHNALTEVPPNLFALPNLVNLNLSHNALTKLPFSAPFSDNNGAFTSYTRAHNSGSLFAPVISRATAPLPALQTLNVSHNQLEATLIDFDAFPAGIQILNLSANPLAGKNFGGAPLVKAITLLPQLRELHLADATLHDDSLAEIPADGPIFPSLKLIDVSETEITAKAITPLLLRCKKELQFEATDFEPPLGAIRVLVGRRIIKESWEMETGRRTKARAPVALRRTEARENKEEAGSSGSAQTSSREPPKPVVKEAWEIEAEEGLMTAGAKRRARAAAAAASETNTPPTKPFSSLPTVSTPALRRAPTAAKEAWEVEVEQGLVTEGARRRARAAAAAAAEAAERDAPPSPVKSPAPNAEGSEYIIMHSRYYSAGDPPTLTLPPSAPSTERGAHTRSMSVGVPASSIANDPHLALPTPTLPLAAIQSLPLAENLRVLILANRRLDQCFSLPNATPEGGFLPRLEKLSLEGCRLGDNVPVIHPQTPTTRTSEPILSLLARLFPSVRILDLSDNDLTSAALTESGLARILLADSTSEPKREGLRRLILRGNGIDSLDGLAEFAMRFKGNRQVPEWQLEELDLGDNQISKLPFELGLLPLDVFLVDGNVFRIPQRRIWEREGTKGLLMWLRGRIE